MWRSLFGELGPKRIEPLKSARSEPAFAATAVFDDAADAAPPGSGELSVDLVVEASAALAMRQHFARLRNDAATAGKPSAMITLLDPTRLWAAQVVRALSDASGQPVHRLNLRERATLRTLALIERTLVPRRGDQPLKVYHADIKVAGADHDAIRNALAERSQLTVVIVGPMLPPAANALVDTLLAATREDDWHCPWLLFLLPPGASALRQRIVAARWPAGVRVAAMAEPLTGPSSVWNSVLTAWEATRREPGALNPVGAAAPPPLRAARAASVGGSAGTGSPTGPSAAHRLANLMRVEGMLGCAVVDLDSAELGECDCRSLPQAELEWAAKALCSARRSYVGALTRGRRTPDEWVVSAGDDLYLLRDVGNGTGRALLAALDKPRANLALLRFRLTELGPGL